MRKELRDATGRRKNSGANGTALPPPDTFGLDSPPPEERDDYGAFEQQRQVEIMQEQDEALDDVFRTVGSLRQQANEMGRELEEQGEMLEDVDNLADRVGGKLQHGIKKVGWVIKKNEGISWLPYLGSLVLLTNGRHMVKLLHRSAYPGAYPPARPRPYPLVSKHLRSSIPDRFRDHPPTHVALRDQDFVVQSRQSIAFASSSI